MAALVSCGDGLGAKAPSKARCPLVFQAYKVCRERPLLRLSWLTSPYVPSWASKALTHWTRWLGMLECVCIIGSSLEGVRTVHLVLPYLPGSSLATFTFHIVKFFGS